MKFIGIVFALLLPTVVWAQDSQVITYIDGDWNADGVADRAYLMSFSDVYLADLAIYTGEITTGDLTLAGHLPELAQLPEPTNGASVSAHSLPDLPVLRSYGPDSFAVMTQNRITGERETYEIFWRDDRFVVGNYTRVVFNKDWPKEGFTCALDYLNDIGTHTVTADGRVQEFDLRNGPVDVEAWDYPWLPEICIGF